MSIPGWLNALFGTLNLKINGTDVVLPARDTANLIGSISAADDPATGCTNFTFSAGGGAAGLTNTEKSANYTLVANDYALFTAGNATLPASPANGDRCGVANCSGGAITVTGTIYGAGSSETLADGATRIYRYAAGTLHAWIRE